MAVYKTKQMKALLEYMEGTGGTHVTAADVYSYFASHHSGVGQTTVYRNLEKLVEQGDVIKYNLDSSSSACYEYVGQHRHDHQEACYHLRCQSCGRVLHLSCDSVTDLGTHLLQEHGFVIDFQKTVFYGICDDCRKRLSQNPGKEQEE